jgi:RNA polymerase-binding transcription factor DksA
MNKHENIAKALNIRLSELTGRVAEIDAELRNPLPADSEERATYLENQDAFEGIGSSEIQKIQQIREALKRIAEGTYGACARCGADIDPKRLKALPYAIKLISCAAELSRSGFRRQICVPRRSGQLPRPSASHTHCHCWSCLVSRLVHDEGVTRIAIASIQ